MKRALIAALGLLALACSKDSPSRPLLPPWELVVTGVRPNFVAAEPALVMCEVNGSSCGPVKSGVSARGNKLFRMERGVSQLKLDATTHLDIAEGSELLVEDTGSARYLELRAGGVALTRSAPDSKGGPLLLRLVDRTLQVGPKATLVAHLDNVNSGQVFVTSGTASVAEPAGSLPAVRDYHSGEGAVFQRKAPPDFHSVFSGQLSRFRDSVLAAVNTPRPPPEVVPEPRGLGSMTARVPGTTAVVEGVRLAAHRVRAVVRDGIAQTEVEEVFQNDSDRVLEGRYVFPLPADATITGLTLFVGDKPVIGELVEKKRAAAIFKGIVDDTVRPRDPALLEWLRGSEFSLKIFPIPARGSRKVLLRYQQVLTADGPRQLYTYPMSLGAGRTTPIDELSIDVDFSDGGAPVQGVFASGYPARVSQEPGRTRVSMQARRTTPSHDFAVSFKRPAPKATLATLEDGFVAVRLRAELPADMPAPVFQKRDRVVVVDTSHSQTKASLSAASALAARVLENLAPDERFALLLCDSGCRAFPESGLSTATPAATAEAMKRLRDATASGSSDLAGALLGAAQRVKAGEAVQIVYVGDGAPSAGELSAASIVRRVRPHFEARRVDLRLIGAGVSVDEVTLGALARDLSGGYERLRGGGSLDDEHEPIVTGLRVPLLVAPRVEVPASVSELEPRALPNLRLGQELVVMGKAKGATPFDVTLRGRLNGAPYALVRSVTLKPSDGAPPFAARLWAESRIRDLETSADPSASSQVIALSQQFRVMSRQTSWLVLETERMFAEFGIPRASGRADEPLPGFDAPSAAERAALAQELDKVGEAEPAESSGPQSPAAPAATPDRAAPSPVSPPAAPSKPSGAGGGLSDIGSTGKKGAAEGSGSSVGSTQGATDPQRGFATIGPVTASGGVIPNGARVVAGMRSGFRNCYVRLLSENPDAAGTVRLAITVGASGAVNDVAVESQSASLSPSLLACVRARARAAQFEPPEGPAMLLVPVAFARQPGATPLPAQPPRGSAPRPAADIATLRPGEDSWMGRAQPALDKLRGELSQSPDSRKRHEALIRGLLLRGHLAEALAAAERFVELDPDLATARELLAYAATATGAPARAVAAVDTLLESAALDAKAHGRAARAFEAMKDELRACAHWRSVAELLPASDAAQYEALRCRARVLGDREAAVADAKAIAAPGSLVRRLLPLLEAGELPAYEKSSSNVGQFEVTVTCEATEQCPYAIAITPTGTVFSPWTPALGRSSDRSFAFSGLLTGTYRVLFPSPPATNGRVEVRALGSRGVFPFAPSASRSVAFAQVTIAPAGSSAIGRF